MEYKDKHGTVIKRADKLRHDSGDIERIYATEDGGLGINASNENYAGFHPLNRKLYPLTEFDLSEWEIIKGE